MPACSTWEAPRQPSQPLSICKAPVRQRPESIVERIVRMQRANAKLQTAKSAHSVDSVAPVVSAPVVTVENVAANALSACSTLEAPRQPSICKAPVQKRPESIVEAIVRLQRANAKLQTAKSADSVQPVAVKAAPQPVVSVDIMDTLPLEQHDTNEAAQSVVVSAKSVQALGAKATPQLVVIAANALRDMPACSTWEAPRQPSQPSSQFCKKRART
eukprot:TRINITY_DN4056_c0_g1_i9.p1 TRINITY_DN4056_c0_g1~~TRINITY_DN4056_c0_g1_i9.p1  ORF type:complete len:253 (+),score=64.38 TRINITY_DN4056_c0_g1_i9:112-759(+)